MLPMERHRTLQKWVRINDSEIAAQAMDIECDDAFLLFVTPFREFDVKR